MSQRGAATPPALGRRLVAAVLTGTLLNPLNSSMIAVALLGLSVDFGVNVATATWLVSGFYLGGAIGMPLMGRLADVFGPRRIYLLGLLLVGLACAVAPLAPSFGWLLAIRVAQAFGTSAAYPAGLAIFRAVAPGGRAPAAALGAVSIANSVSAALGPVLGGGLVTLAGWPGIFLANLPVVLAGLWLAWRWLPADATSKPDRTVVQTLDLPGVLLFSGLVVSLLGFLLSLSDQPLWLLVPATALAVTLFVIRERRESSPFIDVRLLAANRQLVGVYAQFAAVNVVFYAVFFGLPLWLEEARGYGADTTGLLLLPVAGVGVLATPLAARLIDRSGPRTALVAGSVLLLVGSLLLLVFDTTTPVPVLLGAGAVLGVPNGFNNLGLQAVLYETAAPGQLGAASGLFQTFRYVGATLCTALIGLVLGASATSESLHILAIIMAAVCVPLVIASVRARSTPAASAVENGQV